MEDLKKKAIPKYTVDVAQSLRFVLTRKNSLKQFWNVKMEALSDKYDPIYGDDGFDLLLTSEHKEKVITNESDVDEDLGGDIVGECTRLSSSFDAYRSHNDPKGKSKIIFGHETVSPKVLCYRRIQFNSLILIFNTYNKLFILFGVFVFHYVHPKVKSKFSVGDKGLSTKVQRKGKSSVFVSERNLSSHVVSQAKPKSKSFRSTTSTALQVVRKCSTSKK
ncbi:hypothetical protein HanPI659440_Chr16g0629691 [Helianthus annuus]|nr:hypothetical protein HanPI659440_Chr16g0629691 [Helianthus annuus]